MRQEITVKRKLPVNIKTKDLPLFQNSLSVSFERLHSISLKNIWILQDTVFSPGELKFYSEFTHNSGLSSLPILKRAVYCATKTWRKIPKGMWVIDEWSANYFHWMTDCLPRIWEGLNRDQECPVILPEAYKNLNFVTESLKLIGLNIEFFKSGENLHVDTLILTAKSAEFPNFHLDLTEKTRNKLSIPSLKQAWRKIYISRKLASKRIVNNETEVELLLQKKGFEIVYTEKLTLSQQIKLMGETKILVALHGAALTNMLFLPKDAKVLEMRNFDDDLTHCYFNLASALELPYYYTLNRGDNKDTIMTNFTIDLEALEEAITEIESS